MAKCRIDAVADPLFEAYSWSQVKPKITLYSTHPSDTHNANGIRMRYFFEELEQSFETELILPLIPSVKNGLPIWWRLIRELASGIGLSLRLFFSKRNLVILSWPPYITVLTAALTLAVFKRKFILDIRDPYPEIFFELGIFSADSFLGRLFTGLTKFAISRSLGVSVATNGIRKIIDSYRPSKKTITIFNGFDPQTFSRRKSGKFDKFTLIFHGNLAKMQNIDLLIQIARKCPDDIDLVVAGSGPQEAKIVREKRIIFLGSLPHKQIAEIVSKAHVGLSFRNEGLINKISFPVKVFEYMGAGLPVISTPHSEAGSTLEANRLGYQFHNSEVEKIVEKIIFLKHNYEMTTPPLQFSRRGQTKAFVQFVRSVWEEQTAR